MQNSTNKQHSFMITTATPGRSQHLISSSVVNSVRSNSSQKTDNQSGLTYSLKKVASHSHFDGSHLIQSPKQQQTISHATIFTPTKPQYANLARSHVQLPTFTEFYKTHKNYERIKQYSQLNKESPNIYLKMVDKMEHNNLIPRSMHLIGCEATTELSMQGQLQGHKYFEIFSEGLNSSTYKKLLNLDLSKNHLGTEEIMKLSLPQTLLVLDLSNNNLNRFSGPILAQLMHAPGVHLRELNLQHNQLGDHGAEAIVSSLSDDNSLVILNLSHNKLQDNAMESFSQFLRKNKILYELYLHYNQIGTKGGQTFFQGLHKNSTLKVLDLSSNRLGGDTQCTTYLCSVISKPHPELIHFDISRNQFTDEDSLRISTELAFNSVIYGFHFEGNTKFRVNCRGFLTNSETTISKPTSQRTSSNHLDLNDDAPMGIQLPHELETKTNAVSRLRQIDSVNIIDQPAELCWICGGWVEITFRWNRLDKGPIFLHLEFEEYRPSLMDSTNKGYCLARMCPPDTLIRYFFSSPRVRIMTYAKDQATTQTPSYSQIRNYGIPIKYSDGSVLLSHQMHVVNFVKTALATRLFDKYYLPTVCCRPRHPEQKVVIDPDQTNMHIWTLDTSIFKDFEPDTDAHLMQCLEYDLEQSKIYRHIPQDDKDKIKEQLILHYKYIIQCYKYYASQSLNYDYPHMSIMQVQQLYERVTPHISQVDWELDIVSTQTIVDRQYKYIHERGLVRHQFVEMIIRIANNLKISINECMHQVFPFMAEMDSAQSWRDQRYWTQIMDLTIRFKILLLKALFHLASGFSIKKSQTKERFISVQDFKSLIYLSQLMPTYISEEELHQIYYQSMMMQVDELDCARHFEMRFIEFVEGLARVAEKISPNSIHYKDKDLNLTERRVLHLYIKFEGLLYILFYRMKGRLVQLGYGGIEKTVVLKSVLHSSKVKSLGIVIQEEWDTEDSDSETEADMKQSKKSVLLDPNIIIDRLLKPDAIPQVDKQIQSQGLIQLKRVERRTLTQVQGEGWRKARKLMKSVSIASFNPMKALQDAQKEDDQIFEQGSPMTKQRLFVRRQTMSLFNVQDKIVNEVQYDYELEEN